MFKFLTYLAAYAVVSAATLALSEDRFWIFWLGCGLVIPVFYELRSYPFVWRGWSRLAIWAVSLVGGPILLLGFVLFTFPLYGTRLFLYPQERKSPLRPELQEATRLLRELKWAVGKQACDRREELGESIMTMQKRARDWSYLSGDLQAAAAEERTKAFQRNFPAEPNNGYE